MTLADLNKKFPKHRRFNRALSGYIPIDYFNANESEIRAAAKNEIGCYRMIFRGPRPSKKSFMTRRADATHVVIYWR